MAGNPSVKKRQKELARQERQRDKAERREQRKSEKEDQKPAVDPGEDPDLAGIVPGPQPLPAEDAEAEA
ncbi:MAG: hypothetical protein IPI67_25380 [Myxococcales bacterium]|nr:hypothetical protein [Myxococcales bacterium]